MNDLQKDKDDGWKYADTWMTRKSTLTACRLHSTCEFGLKSAKKKIGGWKSCKNGGGVITENFAKKIFTVAGKKWGDDFISFIIFYFFIKNFKNAQF